MCSPSDDEVIFEMTDGGGILLIKFGSPSAAEKRAVKNGSAQFKLIEVDGIIFFLSRFGTMNWMDAPFHRDLAKEYVRPNEGEGLSLHIMLVDARTGILAAQRIIGLQTAFSNALLDMIEEQPAIDAAYNLTISKIHGKYTTNDLVEMSSVEN